MNINKLLQEEYHDMSFKELSSAPFNAINGIDEDIAERIRASFKPHSLSKFVNIADAIVTLAEGEVSEDN
ncbi:MAG: hypothetical protein FWB86_08585 [Treponema sp.]|nr:hypothetical protein [Treponema sp.]MCL2252072.1 hypothetical protein [Treponema sp.]